MAFVLLLIGDGLVGESDAIDFDVVGIESQNIIQSRKKLLVPSEREFHSV